MINRDKKKYRILVIEDNPGDFALIEDFLFEHIEMPEIIHAENFAAALQVLSTDQQFNVVLLDLSLPDKTGEKLITDILAFCHDMPVVVLTGYVDFSFGLHSLALGIADYLLKDELTSISLYKSLVYSIERKKHFAALAESEKKYSDLFNLSPLPMWIIDFETLAFLAVNSATIEHYGYSREEFLSMTIKDIRPAEEIPVMMDFVEQNKESQKPNTHPSILHRLKNGDIITVEIRVHPFKINDRNVGIIIATDVTERLNYIKAIEKQNEKLKEISWIQSHIVRAPLSRIMGLIPLIEIESRKDEFEKMMEYLFLSAQELDEAVKSITNKSRIADYKW